MRFCDKYLGLHMEQLSNTKRADHSLSGRQNVAPIASYAGVQGLGFKLLPPSEKINNSLISISILINNITFEGLNIAYLDEI